MEILLLDSRRDNRIARSIGYAQDILFRNNTTDDTWIEAISDSLFNGWHQVGGFNTSYTVENMSGMTTR